MKEIYKSNRGLILTIRSVLGTLTKPLANIMLLQHGDKIRIFEDNGFFYLAKSDRDGYKIHAAGTARNSFAISTRKIYRKYDKQEFYLEHTGNIVEINGMLGYEMEPIGLNQNITDHEEIQN